MAKLKYTPFIHPFLYAAFPVVFLYAENIKRVTLQQIWQPLSIALLLTAAVFALSLLIFRNTRKAGLFTSVVVVLFFLYRPFYTTFQGISILEYLHLMRHRSLGILFGLLVLVAGYFLFRYKKPLAKLTYVINAAALFLLLPTFFPIGRHALTNLPASEKQPALAIKTHNPLPSVKAPDIYYIVLDGYARQDVLKQVFEQDNKPFLKALEQRGFYIARKSTSNYCHTLLSLAASLNYHYLPALPAYKSLLKDNSRIVKYIQESAVRQELAKYGYVFVNVSSGFYATEIENADHYFKSDLAVYFNEFEQALINTTPVPDLITRYLSQDYFYELHRKLVLFPFSQLPKITRIPSPKFTFVHVLSPHTPFVFDAEGKPVHSDMEFTYHDGTYYLNRGGSVAAYKTGYRNQVSFINKMVLSAIDSIQKNSKKPPVILLQGDHSARIGLDWDNITNTRHREVFSILNAFYLPGKDTTGLYPEISPVNNFRVILNKYFQTNLPLLPDKNYYSGWNNNYDFTEVTKNVKSDTLKALK